MYKIERIFATIAVFGGGGLLFISNHFHQKWAGILSLIVTIIFCLAAFSVRYYHEVWKPGRLVTTKDNGKLLEFRPRR